MTYSVDNGFQQADDKNNKPRVGGLSCDELSGWKKIALNAVDTAGGVFSFENDTANDYILDICYIDVTTASTGACTVDVGIASDATTSDDTLFDGLDVNSATGTFNNIDAAGTNGGIGIKLAAGEFLNASVATGASAGIVGNAYIRFVRV